MTYPEALTLDQVRRAIAQLEAAQLSSRQQIRTDAGDWERRVDITRETSAHISWALGTLEVVLDTLTRDYTHEVTA